MKADLEAAILENPDDDSAYLVLADHLMAESDPRGELIMLQHDFDEAEGAKKKKLEKAAKAHFDKHAEYFEGPIAKQHKAVWRYGFVRSLEIDFDTGHGTLKGLGEILQHPSCQFIVELQVGRIYDEDEYDLDVQGVIDMLVAVKKPGALRSLELTIPRWANPTTEYGEFGELLAAFPHLCRIRLRDRQRRNAKADDPVHEIFVERAKKKRPKPGRSESK